MGTQQAKFTDEMINYVLLFLFKTIDTQSQRIALFCFFKYLKHNCEEPNNSKYYFSGQRDFTKGPTEGGRISEKPFDPIDGRDEREIPEPSRSNDESTQQRRAVWRND